MFISAKTLFSNKFTCTGKGLGPQNISLGLTIRPIRLSQFLPESCPVQNQIYFFNNVCSIYIVFQSILVQLLILLSPEFFETHNIVIPHLLTEEPKKCLAIFQRLYFMLGTNLLSLPHSPPKKPNNNKRKPSEQLCESNNSE